MNPARDRGIRTENEACRMLEERLHLPLKAVNRRKNEGIPEDIGDLIGVPDCTVQVTRCKDDLRAIADRARIKLAALNDQQQRAGTRHGVVLLRIDGAGRRPGVWRAIVSNAGLVTLRGDNRWSHTLHAWPESHGWIIRHAPDKVTGGWHEITNGRYVATVETWAEDMLVPSPSRPQSRFDALQKWEGRVLDIADSTFTAIVVDGMVSGVEEEVEFDLEEVTPGDLDLVVPGAVFYWSIGYRTEPSGERSRSSVLVFRRLPVWSEKDLQRTQVAPSGAAHTLERPRP